MYRSYLFWQEELVTDDFIYNVLCLLPMDRRKKALRYHNTIDRNNCVITYLMLKIALKDCFGITEFNIEYGESGKPYLVEYPDIFFNISHCVYGCVVIVANVPVGVDIQNIVPFSNKVAEKVCCSAELDVLKKSRNKARDFICMWTIKESYLKMTGEGIVGDLKLINTLNMDWVEVKVAENIVIAVCR